MDEDLEELIGSLIDNLGKFRRHLTKLAEGKEPLSERAPLPYPEMPRPEGTKQQENPSTQSTPTSQPNVHYAAPPESTFRQETPPHPELTPTNYPELPAPQGSWQFNTIDLAPPNVESRREPVSLPHPELPPQPPSASPRPLPFPSTMQDLRSGFMANQQIPYESDVAELRLYDQTTDDLYDVKVEQARTESDLRQRQYDLNVRIMRDANTDARRLDDLERQYEQSRENVTDVNI